MNRIFNQVVNGLLHLLVLYFSLCFLSMVITWTLSTRIPILIPGVSMVRLVVDFGHTIFYLLERMMVKTSEHILIHFHLRNRIDFFWYWTILMLRICIVVSGIYYLTKMVVDTSSHAAQNHPMIFWMLFVLMFFSIGVTSSPAVAGTFHISRIHAFSTPWVEYRLLYVLLDAFLKFVLGTYLISLLCLLSRGVHEKQT